LACVCADLLDEHNLDMDDAADVMEGELARARYD